MGPEPGQRAKGERRGERPAGVAVVLLVLALSGCSVFVLNEPLRLSEGDWTTEGGSAARANATAEALAPPLEEAWRVDADGAFGRAAAVIANGVVIVGTRKGELRAYDLDDGRKRSVGDIREPIEGALVATRSRLYVPVASGKKTLFAHDFVRGERAWTQRAGPHIAGLLLVEDALVAASLEGVVRALDPSDGDTRWQVVPDSAADFLATPVALDERTVAVADDCGRVTALDLATGAARWTYDLGAPVFETPAVHGGRLLVPTTRGRLVALAAESGAPEWDVALGGGDVKLSSPAVAGERVVVGASDGRLRALDASTGRTEWTFLSDGNFGAAPLIAGDVVYAGSYSEHIYALDVRTGSLLWQHELRGRVKSTPLVYDGRLVVLAEPRHIYAFGVPSPVAQSQDNP